MQTANQLQSKNKGNFKINYAQRFPLSERNFSVDTSVFLFSLIDIDFTAS